MNNYKLDKFCMILEYGFMELESNLRLYRDIEFDPKLSDQGPILKWFPSTLRTPNGGEGHRVAFSSFKDQLIAAWPNDLQEVLSKRSAIKTIDIEPTCTVEGYLLAVSLLDKGVNVIAKKVPSNRIDEFLKVFTSPAFTALYDLIDQTYPMRATTETTVQHIKDKITSMVNLSAGVRCGGVKSPDYWSSTDKAWIDKMKNKRTQKLSERWEARWSSEFSHLPIEVFHALLAKDVGKDIDARIKRPFEKRISQLTH